MAVCLLRSLSRVYDSHAIATIAGHMLYHGSQLTYYD